MPSVCVDEGPTVVGPQVMLNACLTFSWPNKVPFDREAGRLFGPSRLPAARDENGTDIFPPYSRPNPFKGVHICSYPSPDIQYPIPYPNTQIAYL